MNHIGWVIVTLSALVINLWIGVVVCTLIDDKERRLRAWIERCPLTPAFAFSLWPIYVILKLFKVGP